MKRLITASIILLTASITQAAIYRATVTEVLDGDTIKTKIAGKERIFALAHIDCPELSQPFGHQAADYVRSKIIGKEVAIETKGKNSARETMAEVIFLNGGKSLNYLLVKEGFAWPAQKNRSKPVANLAKQAKAKKVGLWKQEKPLPPWSVSQKHSHAIAQFAGALSASEGAAEVQTANNLSSGTRRVTADDYDFSGSVRQSGDYVLFTGRISGGPACENLRISVYATGDRGGSAHMVDSVRKSPGVKSVLFEGKDYESTYSWEKNQKKEQWQITSKTISCN